MDRDNRQQRQIWKRTLTSGLLGVGLSLTAPLTRANELEVWHHLPENTLPVMDNMLLGFSITPQPRMVN